CAATVASATPSAPTVATRCVTVFIGPSSVAAILPASVTRRRATDWTRRTRWTAPMLQDVPYALRLMRRSAVFTATALLTLALGIGASTATFSVLDNLFLSPPRFQNLDRLVTIVDTNPEKVPPDVWPPPSPGNVLDWRVRARSFDGIAMWRN